MKNMKSHFSVLAILLILCGDVFGQQSIEDFFPVEVESLYVGPSGRSYKNSQTLKTDGCGLVIVDSIGAEERYTNVHIRDFVTDIEWVHTESFLPGQQHYYRKKYILPKQATEKLTRISWVMRDGAAIKDMNEHVRSQSVRFSIFSDKKLGPEELLVKAQVIESYLHNTLSGYYGPIYQRNYRTRYSLSGKTLEQIQSLDAEKTKLLQSVEPVSRFMLTVREDILYDVIQAMHDFNQLCVPK